MKRWNGRSRIPQLDHGGFTLIECLVAIVILGLMVGGVTAMVTVTSASSSANQSERADVLLSAFGEAVKNLTYATCTDGGEYRDAFDVTDGGPTAILRIAQGADVTLKIGTVALGPDCDEIDPGTQVVPISVRLGTAVRSGEVVKRDPSPRPTQLNPTINAQMTSDVGATQVVYQLDAIGSTPIDAISSYDWDCGLAPSVDLPAVNREDDTIQCVYTAPAIGSPAVYRTVSLTVLDDATGRVRTITKPLEVLAQAPILPAPTPLFTYSPASNIVTGNTVTFTSLSTPAPGGQINKWEWDFGDNSSVSCTRPDLSCLTTSHKYNAANPTYIVRHWVTDANNVRRLAPSQQVEVLDAAVFSPIPSFTISPSTKVAPQHVSFDGSGSKDAFGAAVAAYEWNFGDPAGGPTNTATSRLAGHDYGVAGTYSVTLKVTDVNGTAKSLVQSFKVDALKAPAMTLTQTCRSEAIVCWGGASFRFEWKNLDIAPGEAVKFTFSVTKNAACAGITNLFGTQTIEATAGPVGTSQHVTIDYGSAVCKGKFSWSVQARKVLPALSNPVLSPTTEFDL